MTHKVRSWTELGYQPITDELLQEITRKIVAAFDPEKVILFGSHAYGSPAPDSDLDLLVVMESDERPAARSARVSAACRPRFVAMDILVRTPQELEQRLQMGDFFLQEIVEKGRVLYERRSG
jgi:predicted nucleotidyltransferase